MIIGVGIDNVQSKRMKEMLLKWADRKQGYGLDLPSREAEEP